MRIVEIGQGCDRYQTPILCFHWTRLAVYDAVSLKIDRFESSNGLGPRDDFFGKCTGSSSFCYQCTCKIMLLEMLDNRDALSVLRPFYQRLFFSTIASRLPSRPQG